jgi:hypothetical protein
MHTQLTFSIERKDKILFDALALLLQQSPGAVFTRALCVLADTLEAADRDAILQVVERSLNRAPEYQADAGMTAYSFRRLCFKKSVIDSLGPEDMFRVDTPYGSFAMTKADFMRDFANVLNSASYQQAGLYHYPKVPQKAERYRCSDNMQNEPGDRVYVG